MGTIGTRQLRRSGLSRKRARRSIEAIEAYFGRTISSSTSDNQTSKEALSKSTVANDNKRGMEKTNK